MLDVRVPALHACVALATAGCADILGLQEWEGGSATAIASSGTGAGGDASGGGGEGGTGAGGEGGAGGGAGACAPWAVAALGAPGNTTVGTVTDMAAFSDARVAVVGEFGDVDPISFAGAQLTPLGRDVLFAILGPDGSAVSVQRFGDAHLQFPIGVATGEVDGQDAVVAVGHFHGTLDFGDGRPHVGDPQDRWSRGFVAVRAADGAPMWSESFGSDGSQHLVYDAVVLADGRVGILGAYAGALFAGGPTGDAAGSVFAAVVDRDVATGAVSFAASGRQVPAGLALFPDGDAALAVRFSGSIDVGGDAVLSVSDGGDDGFIGRYADDGTNVWFEQVSGIGEQVVTDLAVTPSGVVVAVGTTAGGLSFGNDTEIEYNGDFESFVLFVPPDPAGAFGLTFGGLEGKVHASSVAILPGERIAVSGFLSETVSFAGVGSDEVVTTGSPDAFVLVLDSSGGFEKLHLFPGSGLQRADAVVATRCGVAFGGTVEETMAVPRIEPLGPADSFRKPYVVGFPLP